jgi:hypothetical protein
MCTNRVKDGVILFISSIAGVIICGILFVVLIIGSIGAAIDEGLKENPKSQVE